MDELLEEYKKQKSLFIEALVQKEHMELYESNLLKNEFVLKLGEPRYDLHKLELTIARLKLKLEMMETCAEFKIPIDLDFIDSQLEKEFEKHYTMLKSMKKEIDNVHSTGKENVTFIKDMDKLKELYTLIVIKVHPDVIENPDLNSKKIWKAAKAAYKKGDKAKLERIYKKVLSLYDDTFIYQGTEMELKQKYIDLKEKTQAILSEIETIKKQFPFNETKILYDEEAVLKFKNDIGTDIKNAKLLLDKLETKLLEKLPSSGKYLN